MIATHFPRHLTIGALLALAAVGTTRAQITTISQGNATFELFGIPDHAAADAPRTTFTADAATSASVGHSFWWYFRLAGDSRETTLHGGIGGNDITSIDTTPDRVVMRWDDVDGRGFSAVYMITVASTGATSGYALHQLTVTNESGSPMDIDLFGYADVDQCATPSRDSATGTPDRHSIVDTNCATAATEFFGSNSPSHFTVGSWPTVLDLLVDGVAADLPDTGLPYDSGSDYTAAMQFTSPTMGIREIFTAVAFLSHGSSIVHCGAAATADVFGIAAPGITGPPRLFSPAPPVVGGAGEIVVDNAIPNTGCIMFLGTQLLAGQTGVNAFGLTFYLNSSGNFSFGTDANGEFRIDIPLSLGSAGICGQHFYMRALIPDPASTTQFGLASTNVLDWFIGQ